MELNELLYLDLESLNAAQAGQVATDTIAALAKGGITRPGPGPPQTLLVAAQEKATGRKIGDSHDHVRKDVLQKIQEAEDRGDKRTARYLAESMVAADVAAADLAEQDLTGTVDKFIADDIAAAEARRKERTQEMIDARIPDLMYALGNQPGYTKKQAREQATREIVGRPRYEDEINDQPEKPDRQAILDSRKAAL
jgi:hypothetical protein